MLTHVYFCRFAASFKFEFSKKRLNWLTFDMIRRICLILIDDWVETSGTGGGGVEVNVGTADADEGSLSCEPSLDKDYLTSLRELKVQSNVGGLIEIWSPGTGTVC